MSEVETGGAAKLVGDCTVIGVRNKAGLTTEMTGHATLRDHHEVGWISEQLIFRAGVTCSIDHKNISCVIQIGFILISNNKFIWLRPQRSEILKGLMVKESDSVVRSKSFHRYHCVIIRRSEHEVVVIQQIPEKLFVQQRK